MAAGPNEPDMFMCECCGNVYSLERFHLGDCICHNCWLERQEFRQGLQWDKLRRILIEQLDGVRAWLESNPPPPDWDNNKHYSQDEVEDDPLSDSATTLTVNDVDGENLWGIKPRLHTGLLVRIESEYAEITATDTSGNTATVVRGRNGTTAAEHVQNKQIDIWRPPEDIGQAALILAVRHHQRALQGFADSRANTDLGEMFWLRKIDPEAQELLAPYRLKVIP